VVGSANFHWYIEFHCHSCQQLTFLDHRESASKYREFLDCHRVPELDQEQLDHRLTSLLWAHQFVSPPPDGRTGTAERRTPASGAAGSGGLTPDPEGGPQVDHRETNERRSGAVADGGSEVER